LQGRGLRPGRGGRLAGGPVGLALEHGHTDLRPVDPGLEAAALRLREQRQRRAERGDHRGAGGGDLRLDLLEGVQRRAGRQGRDHAAERGGGVGGGLRLLELVVDLLGGELRHQLPLLHPLAVLDRQPLDLGGGGGLQVGLARRLHHPGRADVFDHVAGVDHLGRVAVVASGGAGTEGERGDQAQGDGGSPGRPVPHPPPLPCLQPSEISIDACQNHGRAAGSERVSCTPFPVSAGPSQ
jgi:hypothetical protein